MFWQEYQTAVMGTAFYPNIGNNLAYVSLGLGEVGEVQGKIKKIYRDSGGEITYDMARAIRDELGDSLWYVAALCHEARIDFVKVMRHGAQFRSEILTRSIDRLALNAGAQVGILQDIADSQIEAGNVEGGLFFWHLVNLVCFLREIAARAGYTLEEVAEANKAKLTDRKDRGVLVGSGDTR